MTKRVKKQRNNTKKNKLKGGGCGCGLTGGKRKNKKSKINKNKRKVKGGSQHLESLPIRYYYPLNDHSSNLSESYGIESTTGKITGGKNGYGAKLTNIFSKTFTVESVDRKAKLIYKQTWRDNMTI